LGRVCFQTQKDGDTGGPTEILRDPPVDILLADVSMPGMYGVELKRATRKTHPHLIMLLRPAHAADDLLLQGLAEGIKTEVTGQWMSICFPLFFRPLSGFFKGWLTGSRFSRDKRGLGKSRPSGAN